MICHGVFQKSMVLILRKNYRNLGIGGIYEGVIKSCGTSLFEFFEEIISDVPKKYRNVMILFLSVLTAFMFEQSKMFLLVGFLIGLIVILEKTKLKEKLMNMPAWIKFIYTYLISFVLL